MAQEPCLIGLDAGATLVTAIAFDRFGLELCRHEYPMRLRTPQPLSAEQSLPQLWQSVKIALAAVAAELTRQNRIAAGVGLTSTGDGTFLMTRAGEPIRGGLLGCDGRAKRIVERMQAEGIADAAFKLCGSSVCSGSQPAQLRWLRENEPESLRRAEVIFHAKDWLFYKLTGVVRTDETDASPMLNLATRRYDPALFKIFGLEDQFEKFPEVKSAGENVAPLAAKLARELGLPLGTVVGSGPTHVAAHALGSGAIEPGQASTILARAALHRVVMDRPMLEPHLVGATLCHGVKERWLRTMTALTATPNLDWFIRELAADLAAKHAGPKLHTQLDLLVAKTPAGAKGVMFHPYLSPAGERSPFVQPAARGSFTGLSLEHTRAHLLRAVYEGVAFAMRDCYQHMPVAPKSIVLSGDGSSSPVWCQILADCLGQTVSVPAGSAFGAKGAAISVGVATGFYPSVRDGVKQSVRLRRHYRPKPPRAGRYAELYPIYRETAQRQMELWDQKSAGLCLKFSPPFE